MKRVLTIQDISCFGKCSLTVALPIISAMGVETVILPTAVLSTHTLFEGFTCKDLSDQLEPITRHWKEQNITFDAIYTGYLGTKEEIDQVKEIFKEFGNENTLLFVDPAMGDNGKLYPAFDESYARYNATLCALADVIVPNITEACYMTGADYKEEYDEAYIKDLLNRLVDLGSKTAVLTGVSLSKGKTGAMGYNKETGAYTLYQNDLVDAKYHGTGDVFSSIVVGALMRGLDLQESLKLAADMTAETIRVTEKNPDNPWYGVDFEAVIPEILKNLPA